MNRIEPLHIVVFNSFVERGVGLNVEAGGDWGASTYLQSNNNNI